MSVLPKLLYIPDIFTFYVFVEDFLLFLVILTLY